MVPRNVILADSSGRAVSGVGLRPLACWDCGFESHRGTWMFVYCECCVLSDRSLCGELITRPEESYRMWCAVVCDLETSWMRRSWPTGGGGGCRAKNKNSNNITTATTDNITSTTPTTTTTTTTTITSSTTTTTTITMVNTGPLNKLAQLCQQHVHVAVCTIWISLCWCCLYVWGGESNILANKDWNNKAKHKVVPARAMESVRGLGFSSTHS